ncbi:MAG: acetyl-CoA C-acetyltransferase [Candidatus Obscuribacterales bacterium]|jgi:acetyl-CoA acetyltransferase family protein|nr:acetyl-CoA C-acetyltransferase [Candidatus Obscuribacterales bacterium]
MSQEIVILSGARTAFGSFGGGLASKTATELATAATQGALERGKLDPQSVDYVVVGNVLQTSQDAIYMGRHIALKSGMRMDTSALIINQLCGSGVQAACQAEALIRSGQAETVIAAGTEALSMTPYINWSIRWGGRMGHTQMWDGLDIRDTICNNSMGETAENIQAKYKIGRQEQDDFALRSQALAKAAQEAGRLADEIVPVEIKDRKGNKIKIERDEHMRPETTIEGLAKLKPAFKKDGSITPGNACGIVDGGAALAITTMKNAEKIGSAPLARIVASAVAGVPPEIMGIGPVAAVPLVLKKAGLKLEQIDLIEINEAFAVQYLACEKDLGLDRDKVNVNGGAIAIGHPFGATGGRLLLSISLELQRRKARYGLVSLCIGGGMGIAMIVERI